MGGDDDQHCGKDKEQASFQPSATTAPGYQGRRQ
jgi:hypothetical protein